MSDPSAVRVLSASDVAAALPIEDAILAQKDAFAQLANAEADIPPRTIMATPSCTSLFMPGYLARTRALGLKAVSVAPGNATRGLPTVPGAVLLLDPDTGCPAALMDAAYMTAVRTAAGSALAADYLADDEARVLTVFGAGAQARQHIRAMRAVRPIDEVRIVSRRPEGARALAAELDGVDAAAWTDPAAAVRGADLVVAATNSAEPVFPGAEVGAGSHVTAVGAYTPETREVDEDVVVRARVVVDTREGALEEAGDLLIPHRAGLLREEFIDADLGQLVTGQRLPGREGRAISFYKSVGTAAQDLATAHHVFREAEARGLGTVVPL